MLPLCRGWICPWVSHISSPLRSFHLKLEAPRGKTIQHFTRKEKRRSEKHEEKINLKLRSRTFFLFSVAWISLWPPSHSTCNTLQVGTYQPAFRHLHTTKIYSVQLEHSAFRPRWTETCWCNRIFYIYSIQHVCAFVCVWRGGSFQTHRVLTATSLSLYCLTETRGPHLQEKCWFRGRYSQISHSFFSTGTLLLPVKWIKYI